MAEVIAVRALSKTYRVHKRPPGIVAAFRSLVRRQWEDVHAVRELTFSIRTGERVGFLGPNGAGKTTTLKMLSGLLHPTAGTVSVGGMTPQRREEAFLRSITLVMGQKQQLSWDLPPVETYALNRAVYGLTAAASERTLTELTDMLGAGELVQRPTRTLSLGERMKCELIAALLHQPRVLFLDEPTIGLDVSMQAVVRDFIRRYNEQTGATVILTSHYMQDVTALCPRVVVIDKGSLVFDGEVRDLVARVRPEKRVVVRLSEPVDEARLKELGGTAGEGGRELVLHVPAARVKDTLRGMLDTLPVADFTVEDPPLDDVMRELFLAPRGVA